MSGCPLFVLDKQKIINQVDDYLPSCGLRLKEFYRDMRYPSIARQYQITYLNNNEKPSEMRQVEWSVKDPAAIDKNIGIYFLRTNSDRQNKLSTNSCIFALLNLKDNYYGTSYDRI